MPVILPLFAAPLRTLPQNRFQGHRQGLPQSKNPIRIRMSPFLQPVSYSANHPGVDTSWVDAHWPLRLYILKVNKRQ
jgi:hypothetical protein